MSIDPNTLNGGEYARPVSPAPERYWAQPVSPAPYHSAVDSYPRPFGQQGPAVWVQNFVPHRPSSSVATAALVFGVIGILAGWCTLGLPCLLAVVLGHLGVNETRNEVMSGRGAAVAGLILGYVMLVPAIILCFSMFLGRVS